MDALVAALNTQVTAALSRYNSEFAPRYFGRLPAEPLPAEPARLTGFRSRLGTLTEYGLGMTIGRQLMGDSHEQLYLSFVPTQQFPDFYIRGPNGEVLLRIEAKALHDESAEASARFDLPTREIQPSDDLLLYMVWALRTTPVVPRLEYPKVLEALVVPAIDIAEERDRRQVLAGGRIDAHTGEPQAPPTWKKDTNFGKVARIVHNSRRDAPDLSPHVRAFLDFTRRHAAAVRATDGDDAS